MILVGLAVAVVLLVGLLACLLFAYGEGDSRRTETRR